MNGADAFVPGDFDEAMRSTDAEGNTAMIKLYSTFLAVIGESDAEQLLQFVAVPSEIPHLAATLPELRAMLADRGLSNRPFLAAPEVAYLKLPPSPPQHLVLIADATSTRGNHLRHAASMPRPTRSTWPELRPLARLRDR
jgi:hypothetical protein